MTAWCPFKICRTSGVEGRLLHEADVPISLLELQSVGGWDGIQIFPDVEPGPDGHWQFPRVSAGWEQAGPGYIVQCFETTESLSFFLATSPVLSKPEVYVELGGATQELWPQQLFTPYDLTLKAIRHFLATGLQDPALFWVGLSDFARRTVARRSRGSAP
jgi:hypothetical protein